MREALAAVSERAKASPRRRVLFVVGRDPVYVAGPGSHLDRLIDMVAGENVARDAASPYQLFSMEAVLERMPDVIIDTSDNREDATRGRVAGSWGQWPFLPAVQRERVYQVDPRHLVIPGIRLPEMALLMGKLVQPEVFGEPSDAELR
jgi:iron complex transport system substrate-binding protein